MNKKQLWTLILFIIIVIAGVTFVTVDQATAPVNEDNANNAAPEQQDDSSFDRSQHRIDEPGSPWWIVSRQRPLPDGYVPPDLTVPDIRLRLNAGAEQMQVSEQILPDLKAMFAAAEADGVELVFGSGYRSEELQRQFYESYVAREGQAAADRFSARPGTSEHQTGLTVDITSPSGECHLETCFEDTEQGQWAREHAHEYGFIIRYLEGKEDITGYQYEPWHLRYVGKELAAELHKTGQTMEEYFDLVD